MEPQDPLAQLRDIHLPQAISVWPPAPGWWIVALICLALVVAIFLFIRRRIAINSYRKLAITALKNLDKTDPFNYLQQLNQLLKQTALASGCNIIIGSYTGDQWLNFLDNSFNSNDNNFTGGVGEILATGPYVPNPSFEPDELEDLAQRWIKHHKVTGQIN